jgi:hypothetical protein
MGETAQPQPQPQVKGQEQVQVWGQVWAVALCAVGVCEVGVGSGGWWCVTVSPQ